MVVGWFYDIVVLEEAEAFLYYSLTDISSAELQPL